MNEAMHFEITLKTRCTRSEARILVPAAAVCLSDAMGSASVVMWPGEIVVEGETAATVVCLSRADGEAKLAFQVAAPFAEETLPARIEAALIPLAEGLPENGPEIIQAYCNRCRTLMKFVDTVYRGMPVYGFAFAVDKFGGLMVMTQESRTVVTVYTGRAVPAKDEPQQPDMPLMPRV